MRLRLEDLRDADLSELHALYDEGTVPDEEDVHGEMRGLVLAGRGIGRTRLWRRAANLAPWAGMRVEGSGGVNHIGFPPFVFDRYGFESHVEREGDGGALVLDYDVEENPYALRRLEERLRGIEDGLFLGKSYLRVGGGSVFLHYYAVESAEGREIPVE
jgi:hypothetical protein